MATILLQAAGGLVGGVLGGPFGAVLGRAAGALAGASIDAALFGTTKRTEGPRLTESRIMGADEGAGIPRVYGTARVAGQVIWATRFEEDSATERRGGKGGGPKVESTTYSYYGNVAVGLCEGPIAGIRRIWADGEEIDREQIVHRVYPGNETQAPDPLIEARQGAGNAPAYRGLAYLVFKRLPLERWGNRLPQITCEILRPVGQMETQIRAVTIIPGASEHGLDPLPVRERLGPGEDRLVNRNMLFGPSDWTASLDELETLCPALERAALVVSWFGDDLRAGHCILRPGIEIGTRDETEAWRAGGVGRGGARLVSRVDGGPAFGGTPSDRSVLRAIADLKARGLAVTYYPFVLMDVPPGNGLPDPYGAGEQAAFPWRGRMTLDLEPGRAGSTDGTAAARAAIAAFLGTAGPEHFSVAGGEVVYSGPAEWSYRRMIFHQAALAALAGVDAFVIGSEMRGLTRLRDETGAFPFVEGLIAIAEAVKGMLPGAVVTYAADWSEYAGYQPTDGSGDVFYNLDPLWTSPAIDVVGIDNYLPLADLRDASEDAAADETPSQYDRAALRGGIAGGEYFDWYYASAGDRGAGLRTPITDGAHGKPWVYRAKDLAGWWANPHVERRGGVEIAGTSPWLPMGKPIWFTELGCPAIDKGANQPNVFVDPKSSESYTPHFSAGGRDDLAQRRFVEAHLEHWDPASPVFDAAANPVSPVYGRRMVAPDAIHLCALM
ncbi:putative phage host specificity protein [Aurantimonas manganoxydans SI85-9A1]|uniref:Putative phage host specificity protein n=1 Tax=Aurantimonas manganoxydans (strain ATCC BAA-1229 / DSM 21871 / SI85-9A1) TaxID=287752 RepID=Q1YJF4_AURMS|nr:glycoside hydrolase TIM-barrel-like domain-containing protein [Aurantimonas manganoxydans]EAS50919.1 putative phage host specificity protein [Aurantimonas manganoxydans SI85-9A1]